MHVRAGRIAAAELYVAVLLLYHRINSWPLGGGLKKPPTRAEVLDALRRHDAGGKGYLTHDEFVSASQDLFACVARAHVQAAARHAALTRTLACVLRVRFIAFFRASSSSHTQARCAWHLQADLRDGGAEPAGGVLHAQAGGQHAGPHLPLPWCARATT
jgi:hypothetical protein